MLETRAPDQSSQRRASRCFDGSSRWTASTWSALGGSGSRISPRGETHAQLVADGVGLDPGEVEHAGEMRNGLADCFALVAGGVQPCDRVGDLLRREGVEPARRVKRANDHAQCGADVDARRFRDVDPRGAIGRCSVRERRRAGWFVVECGQVGDAHRRELAGEPAARSSASVRVRKLPP